MQTFPPSPSPWAKLHTYFKLGLSGTNFLILTITMAISLYLSSCPLSFIRWTFAGYVFITLLLSNQFICIYFKKNKNTAPSISHVFFNKKFGLTISLSICVFLLLYPFYYFSDSNFITTLYSLFFVLFSPAIIVCVLSKNKPIVFITQNLSRYLFCLINITLMGLGYKSIVYYAMHWIPSEFISLVTIGLGAYLFLVFAYIIYDLSPDGTPTNDIEENQDILYLKKQLSLGNDQVLHDFFKPSMLANHPEEVLDFYLKFLLVIQDQKKIDNFGNRWLKLLFYKNNIKKSVSVYECILKKNAYFAFSEPLINYTLSKNFLLTKQFSIVIHLLKNFEHNSPHFQNMPEVLFMLATAYLNLNLETQAKQSLELILKKFPTSEYYFEAANLQKILQIKSDF